MIFRNFSEIALYWPIEFIPKLSSALLSLVRFSFTSKIDGGEHNI
jgi:hypothetical protein